MPAQLVIPTALEDFTEALDNLGAKAEKVSRGAVYEGMRVLADAYKRNISALRVDNTKFVTPHGRKINVVDAETKAAMAEGVGIMRFEKVGHAVRASLSVSGYGPVKTKKYPGGQPLPMIGRSIEGGTAYRLKQSFSLITIEQNEAQAVDAMSDYFIEAIQKMVK